MLAIPPDPKAGTTSTEFVVLISITIAALTIGALWAYLSRRR